MKGKLRFKGELVRLIKSLKKDIGDDYRASDDPDDDTPGMCLTVSTDDDGKTWSYQTGDNSYSGGCYGDPYWGVVSVYRRSRSADLADDLLGQLADQLLDS